MHASILIKSTRILLTVHGLFTYMNDFMGLALGMITDVSVIYLSDNKKINLSNKRPKWLTEGNPAGY